MHASRSLLLAGVALLVAASPAAAQAPTPTPTPTVTPTATPIIPTPTPTVTPAPTPVAVAGRLHLAVRAKHHEKQRKLGLMGDIVVVRGVLRPATAGQRVIVRLLHGHKVVKTRRAHTKANGRFTMKLQLKASGHLSVRAVHPRSSEIKTARAKGVRILAFRPSLSFGSRGPLVRLFQRGLRKLRYPAPLTNVYDAATGRAVMAFRKLNGMARTESPNASIVRRVLAGRGGYVVQHPHAGHHVEADISRQILVLIDGTDVVRIEPTSSGKPSTPTVMGTYHFYSKTPGTNSHGMVYSNYFIRGYAIHGYADVPSYNASHGCLRIPIPDAIRVYNWINLGDTIFVEP
ncbi:MAG: hypothetical protein QOI80_3466 [Solirubrobacteraceae bacterium]|jgi:hypothetical protein|nr:hypothetical protein [Solirubrobacteraceae bacterium]